MFVNGFWILSVWIYQNAKWCYNSSLNSKRIFCLRSRMGPVWKVMSTRFVLPVFHLCLLVWGIFKSNASQSRRVHKSRCFSTEGMKSSRCHRDDRKTTLSSRLLETTDLWKINAYPLWHDFSLQEWVLGCTIKLLSSWKCWSGTLRPQLRPKPAKCINDHDIQFFWKVEDVCRARQSLSRISWSLVSRVLHPITTFTKRFGQSVHPILRVRRSTSVWTHR